MTASHAGQPRRLISPIITRSVPSHPPVTLMVHAVSALCPQPCPFVWFPLAGQRYAIDRRDRNAPLDNPMRTLCDTIHPRGPDPDMEWLRPTCPPCWRGIPDRRCRRSQRPLPLTRGRVLLVVLRRGFGVPVTVQEQLDADADALARCSLGWQHTSSRW
ncbi:MAG: hypothetical protein LC799_27535 [Actinobacteria bacterium]|nr:hypothetical protein [Actinomycetota bacterium]